MTTVEARLVKFTGLHAGMLYKTYLRCTHTEATEHQKHTGIINPHTRTAACQELTYAK